MRLIRSATVELLCLCLAAGAAAQDVADVRQAAALDGFAPPPMTVAPGFEVSVAAAPPLVKHPLMAGFDGQGRLYIAESAGENLRREELEKRRPNFVRRLEDLDGDGVFDRSTIFADGLTLPQGALWHDGALYVAAPPNIWKFEDRDDDGVAERRELLVDRFGYTGNAASIHGCFLGPTGRIYWCDGRHGHEVYDESGKLISQGKAARIFSCRKDGSDFRVHCGGGMDNPVEIDFTPTGEMLGTVNLFYRQRGDCLVHWLHGGAYPRYDQKCIEEFPRTGELLKEVHNLGHVAVSGMTRLRAEHGAMGVLRDATVSAESDDATHWLLTEFNSHKVMHATLRRKGSTFAAEVRELLASSSPDFHPTDVLEDADGSLLVIDTGGWFRIGCPTSQIAKPNMLGAIYRIRPQGKAIADPRGLKLNWSPPMAELVQRLVDPRPAVVERATGLLANGEAPAAKALASWQPDSVDLQLRRIWALARNQSPAARQALVESLRHGAWQPRAAAAMACGLLGESAAAAEIAKFLTDEQPALRRSAATALGRLGDRAATPHLLRALELDNDRTLRHAIIYALMEIGDVPQLRKALTGPRPQVRYGALLALDQGAPGELQLADVLPLTSDEDLTLRAAALEAMAARPQWREAARKQLRELLGQSTAWGEATGEAVRGLLAAVHGAGGSESLADFSLMISAAVKSRDAREAAILLEFVASLPQNAVWEPVVLDGLGRNQPQALNMARNTALNMAITAAGTHATASSTPIRRRLLALANDSQGETEVRAAAWNAWAMSATSKLPPEGFEFLSELLREGEPTMRLAAARSLAAARLTDEQMMILARQAQTAGPLELPTLLGAWQGSKRATLGLAVVSALEAAPGTGSLTLTQLESLFAAFPASVRDAAQPLLEQRREQAGQRAAALAAHEAAAEGNVTRGRRIFFSRDVGCVACHRIAGEGGNVGPDLTTIGQRRSKRDLLEAVLFPNASQARGFESYLVRLSDGRQLSGLIMSESPHDLLLRTTDQRSLRVARGAVEAMKPSAISVMPAGLEKTMNETQLRDLIAYLQSLQAAR